MLRPCGLLFVSALAGCATPLQGPDGGLSKSPGMAEVESTYRAYIARLPCPEQAICGRAALPSVSEASCEPHNPALASCRFTTNTQYGGPRYTCVGAFERTGEQWSLISLAEPCRFLPWGLPSACDISRLETGLRLDEIIQAVGVADSRSMNRAARVRVRAVTCRYLPSHDAICSYEARPCPMEMQAATGSPDGWCRLETRLIHIGGLPVPEIRGSEDWAIHRPPAKED